MKHPSKCLWVGYCAKCWRTSRDLGRQHVRFVDRFRDEPSCPICGGQELLTIGIVRKQCTENCERCEDGK